MRRKPVEEAGAPTQLVPPTGMVVNGAGLRPGISVVLDVNDLERATGFWSAALGFPVTRPITQFMVLRPEDPEDHRPHLILQKVPEGKVGKNRAHMDLSFPSRDEARDRLLELGARMVQEQPNCIGSHCWYLMADPEGNEFCVVGD